jgi:hypothetical protein
MSFLAIPLIQRNAWAHRSNYSIGAAAHSNKAAAAAPSIMGPFNRRLFPGLWAHSIGAGKWRGGPKYFYRRGGIFYFFRNRNGPIHLLTRENFYKIFFPCAASKNIFIIFISCLKLFLCSRHHSCACNRIHVQLFLHVNLFLLKYFY